MKGEICYSCGYTITDKENFTVPIPYHTYPDQFSYCTEPCGYHYKPICLECKETIEEEMNDNTDYYDH